MDEAKAEVAKLKGDLNNKFTEGWNAVGDSYEGQVKKIAEDDFQDGWLAALYKLKVDKSSHFGRRFPPVLRLSWNLKEKPKIFKVRGKRLLLKPRKLLSSFPLRCP